MPVPTYREMLAPALANPADDFPRLILADWLEEHGEAERAEFIRMQVELAKPIEVTRGDLLSETYHGQAGVLALAREGPRREALRRRERELLNAHTGAWTAGLPVALAFGAIETRCWRRGFVAEVRCPWDAWLAHGDAIRQAQPVEAVDLTTAPVLEMLPDSLPTQHFPRLPRARLLLPGRRPQALYCGEITPANRRGVIEEMLGIEWPGVTFTLPRGEHMTTLNGLLRQIRDQVTTQLGAPAHIAAPRTVPTAWHDLPVPDDD